MSPISAFGFLGPPGLGARQEPAEFCDIVDCDCGWTPEERGCPLGTLLWRDLKRVLLGSVGQGHAVWENMQLTYIRQEEKSQLWLCLEKGTGEEV